MLRDTVTFPLAHPLAHLPARFLGSYPIPWCTWCVASGFKFRVASPTCCSEQGGLWEGQGK